MNFIQKYVYFIASGIVLLGYFVGNAYANNQQTVCPDGSYAIDQGVCKQEPTGCPYGDSIPLDSPKCVPPVETPAVEPVPQPVNNPVEESTCRQ